MVSHDPSSPSSGRVGDQAVHPASQTGSAIDSVDWDADGSDESAYASAASSPTSPPSSPVVADMVTGSEERPSRYRSHTVVNITVNATTAPVTVQTGDRARTGPPTTPSAHMSELHRRPGTAQPARTPNQVRSRPPPTSPPASLTGRTPVRARSRQDHASAARAVPVTSSRPRPALPQETLSRVESAPRPMTPVSPITRSRPRPLPISSEAQARRLREIEQVRVEQEEGVMADAPQDATPSLVDPADEHIESPEPGRHRWYVALVGEKVGIWKHYTDMGQHTSGVSGALHQRAYSRSEAEHIYYTAKAEGRVRVVKP